MILRSARFIVCRAVSSAKIQPTGIWIFSAILRTAT